MKLCYHVYNNFSSTWGSLSGVQCSHTWKRYFAPLRYCVRCAMREMVKGITWNMPWNIKWQHYSGQDGLLMVVISYQAEARWPLLLQLVMWKRDWYWHVTDLFCPHTTPTNFATSLFVTLDIPLICGSNCVGVYPGTFVHSPALWYFAGLVNWSLVIEEDFIIYCFNKLHYLWICESSC